VVREKPEPRPDILGKLSPIPRRSCLQASAVPLESFPRQLVLVKRREVNWRQRSESAGVIDVGAVFSSLRIGLLRSIALRTIAREFSSIGATEGRDVRTSGRRRREWTLGRQSSRRALDVRTLGRRALDVRTLGRRRLGRPSSRRALDVRTLGRRALDMRTSGRRRLGRLSSRRARRGPVHVGARSRADVARRRRHATLRTLDRRSGRRAGVVGRRQICVSARGLSARREARKGALSQDALRTRRFSPPLFDCFLPYRGWQKRPPTQQPRDVAFIVGPFRFFGDVLDGPRVLLHRGREFFLQDAGSFRWKLLDGNRVRGQRVRLGRRAIGTLRRGGSRCAMISRRFGAARGRRDCF